MKKIATVLICAFMLCMLTACSGFLSDNQILDIEKNPTGVITIVHEVEGQKDNVYVFNYELNYKEAPLTVTNFIKLIENGHYNNTIFHSLETTTGSNKILQGGGYTIEQSNYNEYDELIDFTKKSVNYSVAGEYKNNGWTKAESLKNTNGTLAMLKDGKNSSGSMFYINIGENKDRNDNYAVFGRITDNSSVLTSDIANIVTENFSSKKNGVFDKKPVGRLYIKSITVNTYGVDFSKTGKA